MIWVQISDKIFNALCAGASGYILKTDFPHEYIEAIREVNNGGAAINPVVAKKMLRFFSTPCMMNLAISEIDYQLFVTYETVRTHVKHIYKKLYVANRSDAVMKAIQSGLFSMTIAGRR